MNNLVMYQSNGPCLMCGKTIGHTSECPWLDVPEAVSIPTKQIDSVWEYKVLDTTREGVPKGEGQTDKDKLTSGLNALGREGWALCGVVGSGGTVLIFKRPVSVSSRTE